MAARDDSKISPTRLGRLAASPLDEAAWDEFVDRYGPRIFQWCRAWGLPEAEIQDVGQAVLSKLRVQVRRFPYDPSQSLRGWLTSLVGNAANDVLAARGRRAAPESSGILRRLAGPEARDDLTRRLEQEFDLELLEAAMQIVRRRVADRTWEAYRLTAREGRSAAEVAELLDMRVGAVYRAKSSVAQSLQAEIRRLEADGPSFGAD
jgi:RNA polymerase sigma-70 factor (ECF subfamily)